MPEPKIAVSTDQLSAPQSVMQMGTGFWVSQTLFAAHDMGIFRLLAENPMTARELCERIGCPHATGERLITACVALGLIERSGDRLANTTLADRELVPGRPGYMGGMLAHCRNDLYPLWGHLDDAVREGSNRWNQAFGSEPGNSFERLYRDPVALENFLYAMQGLSLNAIEGLLAAYDFSQHSCLLDVGGALGTVAVEVVSRHPNLKGITFDLPAVEPLAAKYIASKGLADRVKVASGDMFEGPLPTGVDVIHLSYILHDWPDSDCIRILRNCFSALPEGGTILIGESLLNDDGSGPLITALMSLNMLVATSGGRERTASEYRGLLEAAGFTEVRAEKLPSIRDLVIARKA